MSVDFGGEFKANEVEVVESNFEALPAGIYRAQIIDSDRKDISNNNPKGQCLVLTWEITEGDYANRKIWQRINLWAENFQSKDGGDGTQKAIQIAQSDLAKIGKATGVLAARGSEDFHNRPCMIKLSVKKDKNGQYPDSNEVRDVMALGSIPASHTPQQSAQPAQAANTGGAKSPPGFMQRAS